MSDLHQALTEVAQMLTTDRDNRLRYISEAVTESYAATQTEAASALALVLSALHAWTDGEYGEPYRNQPSAFELFKARQTKQPA